MSEARVRFAPSPTGYLHVGGARTALFNWLFARNTGGKFILRIEDTDVERSSAEMVEGILEGMRWLGLDWDEGPYFQSERLHLYRQAAQRLIDSGNAYRCFCSPEQLQARRDRAAAEKRAWKYDRACRNLTDQQIADNLSRSMPYAVRFLVPDEGEIGFDDKVFGPIKVEYASIEDFVLLRSDAFPTYHLSVVVDDIDMRITHVIRGADHISNTPKQILLYRAFNAPAPVFAHVPLILGPDKSRLSKRHGATSVTAYRDQGFVPDAFRNFLALLGWSPGNTDQEIFSTEELISRFSLEGISRNNAVFNIDKAFWFNAQYLTSMALEKLVPMARKELEDAGLWKDEYAGERKEWFARVVDMLRVRARTLKDFATRGRPYFSDDFDMDADAVAKNLKKEPALKELLPELAGRLSALDEFTLESTEAVLRGFAQERGVKAGLLINAARTALTGSAVSPGIFEVFVAMGKDRTCQRLRRAASFL